MTRTWEATFLLKVEYVLDDEFLNEVREWAGDHIEEDEEVSEEWIEEFCKDRLFDPQCEVLASLSSINHPKEGTNE